MNQAHRREYSLIALTRRNEDQNDGTSTANDIDAFNDDNLVVCWLPSLPLTKKHKAPSIGGLGILYSESLDKVLQVFETDNLSKSVKMFSRDQAAALNIDPECRLHWVEISNPIQRTHTRLNLLKQIQK